MFYIQNQALALSRAYAPTTEDMIVACFAWVCVGAPILGERFPSKLQVPPIIFRTHKQYGVVGGLRKRLHMVEQFEPKYSNVFVKFGDALAEASLSRCGAKDAFDKLIPGAFKSDLLRYCLVWLYGGFYMDMGSALLRPFEEVIDPQATFITVKDPWADGYWNGFLAATPRHPILRTAIDMCVDHVNTCFRGSRDLEVTGPMLLKRAALQHPSIQTQIIDSKYNNKVHLKIGSLIFNKYDGYNEDMLRSGYDKSKESYGILWNQRRVYTHC